MNRALFLPALAATFAALNGMAEYLPFPPKRSIICEGGKIDRDKLAAYLLQRSPISLLALEKLGDPVPRNKREIVARIAETDNLCKKGCADADAGFATAIKGDVALLLIGTHAPTFHAPPLMSPTSYFLDPRSADFTCAPEFEVAEAPGATFVPPPKDTSPIRVRGKPDQLYIDRASKNEFATADKASLGYTRDDVAGTNAMKIVGYAGWHLDLTKDVANARRWELIPYVGLDRNVVRVEPNSTAKASAKSVAYLGTLSSAYLTSRLDGALLGHLINFRPELQADHKTGTRLAVAAVEYLPVRNSILNDYFPLSRTDEYFASAKPILALKVNVGHYVDKGNGTTDSRTNYGRTGAKVGFAVSSDNPYVPLDFEATFTAMHAFQGSNITYRAASLTYSFDPNKYFGITLGLKKGKREDTAQKDDEVTIGLTAKY